MEERPIFSKSEDDDEENDDQSKKKQSTLAELFTKEERSKEEASKDIARSIFGDKKSETDASDEPDANAEELEQEDELSDAEAIVINQEIAENHLANPVVSEQPAPPVIEFLELVVNGVESETAFGATKVEYQLDESNLPETDSVEDDTSTIAETVDRPLGVDSTTTDQAPDLNKAPHRTESKPRPVVSKVATKIATSISKRRVSTANSSSGKTVGQANERRLEHQVASLEARLTKREQTLQRLSELQPAAPPIINANNNPFERMQPGINESRLNLNKPERAGHIGKMLVGKERAGEQRNKPSLNTDPDQVKSMRREDLLTLSANLKVQGASLKHMFENNLFSEAALRRMVEAHLRGRDMLPLLRREILDRQNDFDRDPRLRNRQPSAGGGGDELFDQMLVAVDNKRPSVQTPQSSKPPAPNTSLPLANSPLVPTKPAAMPVANAILGITIALLVGLILFFAFR